MASTVLTDEDRGRITQLASDGLSSREIARQLELPLGSVGGYIAYLKREGVVHQPAPGIPGNPAPSTGPQPSSSIVSEVATAIKDGVQIGRETAKPTEGGGGAVETATKAIETGIDLATRGSGNGNGQPHTDLLKFLSTVVTQQRDAHTNVMEQIQSRHNNDLARIQKDHDLRMEETKQKVTAERNREQDYWKRIEEARQTSDKQRGELEKEERKLISEKLDSINEQSTRNLEHANKLIEQREKSSDRYIEMSEKFSGELAELRKEMGKEDGTQELIKHTIEKLGEPIIRAIEKRAGGDNKAVAALGTTTTPEKAQKEGVSMGLGGKMKSAVKQALLKQFAPYIKEGLEQVRKHLQKWPKVSIKVLVDLLWSWRMHADATAYIQTAVTFIVLNDVDELVKKAGDYLTDDLRKLLATPKAKKWWAALQDAINERIAQEEEAARAYQDYTRKPEEEKKEKKK